MLSDNIQTTSSPEIWTNVLGMKFRLVHPGRFRMGSPLSESRRFADETERETVISQEFYLSVFPTTQAEWRAVTSANPSKYPDNKKAPVETISWFDCADFIEKLNSEEYGQNLHIFLGESWEYSFPTEAQWEYACRADTTTPYYFGVQALGEEGNFGKNNLELSKESVGSPYSSRINRTTSEVGAFPPNPWGFYDMCGNVCEWTLDSYADYDLGQTIDPCNTRVGAERVARGGSWRSQPDNCRSASRFNFLTTYRGDNCGLRLAIVRRA